jgi:hypothetical protein
LCGGKQVASAMVVPSDLLVEDCVILLRNGWWMANNMTP